MGFQYRIRAIQNSEFRRRSGLRADTPGVIEQQKLRSGWHFFFSVLFCLLPWKSQGAIKTPVAAVHGGTGGNYRKCMSYFVHWVGQQSCLSVKSGRMVFCHVCCNLHTCMLVYVKRFEPGIWNMALYNFHHQVFLLTPFSTICFSSVQDVAVQRGRHYFLGNNQFVHKLLSLK